MDGPKFHYELPSAQCSPLVTRFTYQKSLIVTRAHIGRKAVFVDDVPIGVGQKQPFQFDAGMFIGANAESA